MPDLPFAKPSCPSLSPSSGEGQLKICAGKADVLAAIPNLLIVLSYGQVVVSGNELKFCLLAIFSH